MELLQTRIFLLLIKHIKVPKLLMAATESAGKMMFNELAV
jgi:hypothetical protein